MSGEGVNRDDVSGGVIGESEEGVNEESKWGGWRCEWRGCGVSGRV